jgi:hypothetical protein
MSGQAATPRARRSISAAPPDRVDEYAPQFPTRVRFRTETGSIYELVRDAGEMRWKRLSATLASGPLRSDNGVLTAWPDFTLGEPCVLWSEPMNPPWDRIVMTTRIVAFLEVQTERSGEGEA